MLEFSRSMSEKEEQEFLESGEPSTLEFLKANISEGFDNTTTGVALDAIRETVAGGSDERYSEAQARENINAFYEKREPKVVDPQSPQRKAVLTEDEWRSRPDLYREGIEFKPGFSEERYKFMADGFDERKEREAVLKAGNPDGSMLSVSGAVSFAGQMIGSLPDPVNLIPIGEGFNVGKGLVKKVVSGAAEGAIGNLAVSAVARPYWADRGIESTWQDYANDLFIGGVMGGGFSAIGHGIGEAMERRKNLSLQDRQVKAKAADAAMNSVLEGEPFRADDVKGLGDVVTKSYSMNDPEVRSLTETHARRIAESTGLSADESNLAASLHVANAYATADAFGMTPDEFLNSKYGADFQRATIDDAGKISRDNPYRQQIDDLINQQIGAMSDEVFEATKEGGGKIFDDGKVVNTVADISTYPEWYGEIGIKNKEHFKQVVESKKGPIYERIKEIAESRLRDGYESKITGPNQPSSEYHAYLNEMDADAEGAGIIVDRDLADIPLGEDGQPLFKKQQSSPQGAIQFREDSKAIISLFGQKNESTIIHESSHLFLKNMQRLGEMPDAPAYIKDGLKTIEEWAMKQKQDKKLSRADNIQEAFARGFEQYVREGKAPVPALQQVFDKMREWLTRIYKNSSELGVEITPEVRRVYDRMLAMDPRPDMGPVKSPEVPPLRTPEEFEATISAVADDALYNHPMTTPEERAEWGEALTALDKEEQELHALFQSAETSPEGAVREPIDNQIDAFNDKLQKEEAARQRLIEIAAQKKELKRQAYLNLDARERVVDRTRKLISQGVEPEKAILSLLEGASSLRGMEGAGNSLDGRINAIGETQSAKTFAKLREIDPRIEKLFMDDPDFNEKVILEMLNIGKKEAGVSGDPIAAKAAQVFSEMMEEIRGRANLAGASIGKLDGYIPRFHDWEKMIRNKDKWIAFVRENIDLDKSFKGLDGRALDDAIEQTFENMSSGEWLTREAGQFDPVDPLPKRPRNIATKMEQSRELHFKSPEAELEYLKEFGQGRNVLGMMVKHLQNNSRKIAIMEALGTQPEANLANLITNLRQDLRSNASLDPELRRKHLDQLSVGNLKGRDGAVGHAFMLAMGEGTSFAHPRIRHYSSMIRLFNSVSKLGAATLSQFTDFAQIKSEARLVSNNNHAGSWVDVLKEYLGTVSPEVRTEVLDHIATLGDGMNYANFNRFDQDNVSNWVGRMSDKMFKWSGQNWHTTKAKSAMALIITKELGKNVDKSFDNLHPNLKAMLSQYGSIDAKKWDMLRSVEAVDVDGVKYYHPGLVQKIDDAHFEDMLPAEYKSDARPQVQKDLEGNIKPEDQKAIDTWERERSNALRREKYRLETDLQTFFLEESRNGVLEPDARVRRLSTFGTKSGTIAGEAARFMMQFKSFSIAYTDRVLGGKRFSDVNSSKWGEALKGDPSGAIQHVVASLGLAYMSMCAKDLSKGLEPKDPTLAATWLMAGFQSGGLGIMGDFVQNAVSSRSANDFFATLAGPTAGNLAQVATIGGRTLREAGKGIRSRAGEKPNYEGLADDYVNFVRGNMPFGSLWYTRAAVNYLVWDRLKESLEPGSIKRSERRLKKEYNQQSLKMSSFGF